MSSDSSPSPSPPPPSATNPIPIPTPIPFNLSSVIGDRIESFVQSRQSHFDYLIRVLLGDSYWLNVMKISSESLDDYSSKIPSRCLSLHILGSSLGRLVELPSGSALVKTTVHLFEEFEDFIENETARLSSIHAYFGLGGTNVVPFSLQHSTSIHSKITTADFIPKNVKLTRIPMVPAVGAFPFYEYLHIPSLHFCVSPADLSFRLLSLSLLEILQLLYSKYLDESCNQLYIYDTIGKVDKLILKYVVNNITSMLNGVAKNNFSIHDIYKKKYISNTGQGNESKDSANSDKLPDKVPGGSSSSFPASSQGETTRSSPIPPYTSDFVVENKDKSQDKPKPNTLQQQDLP